MNIRFPARTQVTHETWQINDSGGTTWCGISFYWKRPFDVRIIDSTLEAEPAPAYAECDCMACIARVSLTFDYFAIELGLAVINVKSISKLEFLYIEEDKKVK